MSVKVQSLIWEHAPYRGNTLLAFLALGDWSDDEGYCWPKMATLARKSRQSVRSAQYAVELLCRDGFLAVDVKPGKGHQNDFHVNLQKLHLLAAQKVQSTTAKGANGDSKRCKTRQANKEDPSLDPSVIRQGGKAALSGTYSQRDFDERDQRLMGAAYRDLLRRNAEGGCRGSGMTDRQMLEYACGHAGISLARGLELEVERTRWPDEGIKKPTQGVA